MYDFELMYLHLKWHFYNDLIDMATKYNWFIQITQNPCGYLNKNISIICKVLGEKPPCPISIIFQPSSIIKIHFKEYYKRNKEII